MCMHVYVDYSVCVGMYTCMYVCLSCKEFHLITGIPRKILIFESPKISCPNIFLTMNLLNTRDL